MFDILRIDIERTKADLANRLPRPKRPVGTVRVLLMVTTWPVIWLRYAAWASRRKNKLARKLATVLAIIGGPIMQLFAKVWISRQAYIGPGFVIRSSYGLLIGPHTHMGENCTVEQECVIAGLIGNNVYFEAGAKTIALPTIGNNVRVSSNSLVLADVRDNCTVYGVPARVRSEDQVARTAAPTVN